MKRKQPKLLNAIYTKKGKLIGINAHTDHEENRIIFDELPAKKTVQADLYRVEFIVNLSDIRKPSSYYLLN